MYNPGMRDPAHDTALLVESECLTSSGSKTPKLYGEFKQMTGLCITAHRIVYKPITFLNEVFYALVVVQYFCK